MNILEMLGLSLLQNRLVIPSADLPNVAADTAKYTADGQPLTTAQIAAADRAIIDYVLGRIARQAAPHGVGAAIQAVLTPPVATADPQQPGSAPAQPGGNF